MSLDERLQDIRVLGGDPLRVSVYDVVRACKRCAKATMTIQCVRRAYPSLFAMCAMHQFPGERQNRTPVADVDTLCPILVRMPWKASLKRKRLALEAVVRRMGGEVAIDEHIVGALGYDSD